MKEKGSLMRVLFCKIHCSFICLCKPTAAHIYTSSAPLKLENTPNVVVPSTVVSNSSDKLSSAEVVLNEKKEGDEDVLKSCIRKMATKEVGKKRVEWVDKLGKQLAEIKEFESSETGGDTESEEESSRCLCIIL